MRTDTGGAQLSVVDNDERGPAFIARRLDLRIQSVRELARIAQEQGFGLSRDAITKAEEGTASESTYLRLDALLRSLEGVSRDGEDGIGETDAPEDIVEFRIGGNFGVDVVVRGPVTNMAELEEAVARLIREMRAGQ